MRGAHNVLYAALLISFVIFMLSHLTIGPTFSYVRDIQHGLIFWVIVAVMMSAPPRQQNDQGYLLGRANV